MVDQVTQADRDSTLIIAAIRGDLYDRLPERGKSEMLHATWKETDAYGEPGFMPPQGWDWSGIRDSSPGAKTAIAAVAARVLRRYRLLPTVAELEQMTHERLEKLETLHAEMEASFPGVGALIAKQESSPAPLVAGPFCVAGPGFVSAEFEDETAARVFLSTLEKGGINDCRIISSSDARALKQKMMGRRA